MTEPLTPEPSPAVPDDTSTTTPDAPATLPDAAATPDIPAAPPASDRRASGGRLAVVVALALVAVLGGAALFGAGFLLGGQQARTPGTPDDREALFAPFWDAFDAITGRFVGEADDKTLVEGAIKGMFEAIGDPFSSYLTSEEYRSSISGINGSFEGIGAVMATRDAAGEESCERAGPTCHVVVVRTLRDAPATRAGLRADDRIAGRGRRARGRADHRRDDRSRSRTARARRSACRSAVGRRNRSSWPSCARRSRRRSSRASCWPTARSATSGWTASRPRPRTTSATSCRTLVDGGVTGIIVDLRGDPGGFVDAAERIASEFIASGPDLLGGVRRRHRDPARGDPRRRRHGPGHRGRSSSSTAARRAPARSSPGRCRTAAAAGSSASRPSARGPSSSGRP